MKDFCVFLKGVDLFRDLNEDEIGKLCSVCREEHYDTDEIVFSEGSQAEKLFIVLTGRVEVWKDYGGKNSDLLAIHGPGRMFGEMALLDKVPRSATVIAKEPSSMLCIYQEDFDFILGENSSISISIARSVSGMVRRSNAMFIELLRERNRQLEQANLELKNTQDELLKAERLAAIGQFSSFIIHDIRNPIGIIRGYAELIREVPSDLPQTKDRADRITIEVERVADLIEELLDFCRGDIELEMSLVELDLFFAMFSKQFSESFTAHDIELNLEIDPHIKILMDERRMFRVFANLAENAVKAMPDGGTLRVSAWKVGRFLKIETTDTGIGMKPNELEHIFDPFFSGFKARGTGLGMAVVKSIVEAHGGRLNVRSEPGVGSTFAIVLPRAE